MPGVRFSPTLRSALIFVHRWLGVALCLLFVTWFLSGLVMMYWDFPSVGPEDRLERSPALSAAAVQLSPIEAAQKAGVDVAPPVLLNTFDGRPVYRFGPGRSQQVVYADTGEEQTTVTRDMLDRIASAWTGQPIAGATRRTIDDVDQWTVQSGVRDVKPLWKYTWPNGEELYVSEASGEIVQYTTTGSRWGAYLGAIPHWLYFTPLRKHGPEWSRVVIWSSGIGTVSAVLGVVVGIWMYSPGRRYRRDGAPTSIPYRGWKRWHMIFGLVFGLGAVTWAFSGMLSMDPLPAQRAAGRPRGGSEGRLNVPQVLRGRLPLDQLDGKHPRTVLGELSGLPVKELEFTSFDSKPAWLARLSTSESRVVPLDGPPQPGFDRQAIVDLLKRASDSSGGATVGVIEQYDRYYLDRRGELPLPAILVRMNDADRTRHYIDAKSARVVASYNSKNWINRWPYHALHSLNFPWLYNHRPAWDIVVISFMLGGLALSLTSLTLAWQVLARKLSRNGISS